MQTVIRDQKFVPVQQMTTEIPAPLKTTSNYSESGDGSMKTFVIEREIPGAGNFSPADLKAIAQKSCGVLSEMGPDIKWLHSYVVGNKIYCIYQAIDENIIRQHAQMGGFPANLIAEVETIISPHTAH